VDIKDSVDLFRQMLLIGNSAITTFINPAVPAAQLTPSIPFFRVPGVDRLYSLLSFLFLRLSGRAFLLSSPLPIQATMVSRKLLGAYAFASFCMLAAGVISIAFSIVWRAPNVIRNVVIDSSDLTIGIVIGVAYLVTFIVSVGAVIQPVHVTIGLVILNWTLLADAIITLIVGSIIWFFTLRERNAFSKVFDNATPTVRQGIQDALQCCGYFNTTDNLVQQGFCSDPTKSISATPCVGPLTTSADFTLNNIFSSIYGFMAVIIALFFASMCVIKVRQEEERFRRIDEKRGGRGFV